MDVREKPSNEKRMIDGVELRRRIIAFATGMHSEVLPVDTVMMLLMQTPTVYAVEVVRCRECEHWKPTGNKAGNSFADMEFIGGCEFTKYYRRESDFCSWGKRKEGAE